MTTEEIKKTLIREIRNYTKLGLGSLSFVKFCKEILDGITCLEAEADKYYNAAKIQQDVSMKRFFEIKRLKEENERLKKLLDDKCDRCIEKERTEAIKEFADNLCRVFAGHSDYHGDTILTKIICSKEGKPIQNAKPIDTSKIKSAAIKEFAKRLKDNFPYKNACYTFEGIEYRIDNLVKEMVGDNNAE